MTYQSSTKNNPYGFDFEEYDEPNDNSDLDLDYSTDGSDLDGDVEQNGVPEESQPHQSPATPLHQTASSGLLDSDRVQDVPIENELQNTRGANESVSFSSQSNTLHDQSGYFENEIEKRKKETTDNPPSSESATLLDVRSELVTSDQPTLTSEEASDPARVRLKTILLKSNLQGAMTAFDNHGISDMWLPIPKQSLRHFFKDNQDIRSFFEVQNQSLDKNPDHLNIQHTGPKAGIYHTSFEDDDDIIHRQGDLGDGGFGIVEEVSVPTYSGPVMCVRKKIRRPLQLKAQKQLMTVFSREINVMRQVDHPHCVRILGSYTDFDSINILLRPAADTDLAKFLDRPLGDIEKKILYKGIHCLCSALNYLHKTKIRHEDLKPQNVLILGENLLLTDFGFSLDFSDDSISMTEGLPKALTVRYSAPEVLEYEPRNRASDIFSLGCVLYEMISAIDGHSLTEVKAHWKRSGNGQSSFARNPAAASVYLEPLPSSFNPKDLPYLREYTQFMLNNDRLLRPSAQQVVDRVSELGSFLGETSPDFGCCNAPWPPSPYGSHRYPPFDANYSFYPSRPNGYGYILLDLQFNKIASIPTYYHTGLFADFPKIRRTSQALYQMADIERRNPELWNAHAIWKERHGDLTGAEIHVETSARILSLKHVELYRDMDFVCITLETDSSKLSPPVHQRHIWISIIPVSLLRSPYYGAFFYMLSFQL